MVLAMGEFLCKTITLALPGRFLAIVVATLVVTAWTAAAVADAAVVEDGVAAMCTLMPSLIGTVGCCCCCCS